MFTQTSISLQTLLLNTVLTIMSVSNFLMKSTARFFSLYCAEKNVNIKKIGARYLNFLLTQVYKNFTVSYLELK